MITKKVLVQLPEELHRTMKSAAVQLGMTINDYINEAVMEKVKKEKVKK